MSQALVDFQGKVVVVSGASSGIGRAIALALVAYGAKVVALARDRDRLEALQQEMPSGNCHILQQDLRQLDSIAPALLDIVKETGPIYGLCHSAGVVETLPLRVSTVSELRNMLDVNLLAGIELARVICQRNVMEPNAGSVLFISSIYGLVGKPGEVGYSASKGAITSAARTLAVELARRHIRVNTLSPGFVETEMTREAMKILPESQVKELQDAHPLGTGTPEDVARAAAFLLAPQNTWITGADLVIDGGYTAR